MKTRRVGTTDGTFKRRRYFSCEDKCGVFLSLDKLSSIQLDTPPTVSMDSDVRASVHVSLWDPAHYMGVGPGVFFFQYRMSGIHCVVILCFSSFKLYMYVYLHLHNVNTFVQRSNCTLEIAAIIRTLQLRPDL